MVPLNMSSVMLVMLHARAQTTYPSKLPTYMQHIHVTILLLTYCLLTVESDSQWERQSMWDCIHSVEVMS